MPVVVVATITPEPGQEDAVREALLAAVPAVHAEPGCELYALHEARDRDGAVRFVMVERWESADALAVHGKAEALQQLGAALDGKVVGRSQVQRLDPLPAGDPVKGEVAAR